MNSEKKVCRQEDAALEFVSRSFTSSTPAADRKNNRRSQFFKFSDDFSSSSACTDSFTNRLLPGIQKHESSAAKFALNSPIRHENVSKWKSDTDVIFWNSSARLSSKQSEVSLDKNNTEMLLGKYENSCGSIEMSEDSAVTFGHELVDDDIYFDLPDENNHSLTNCANTSSLQTELKTPEDSLYDECFASFTSISVSSNRGQNCRNRQSTTKKGSVLLAKKEKSQNLETSRNSKNIILQLPLNILEVEGQKAHSSQATETQYASGVKPLNTEVNSALSSELPISSNEIGKYNVGEIISTHSVLKPKIPNEEISENFENMNIQPGKDIGKKNFPAFDSENMSSFFGNTLNVKNFNNLSILTSETDGCDVSSIESYANEEPLKLDVVEVEETIFKPSIFELETADENAFETLNDNTKKDLSMKIIPTFDSEELPSGFGNTLNFKKYNNLSITTSETDGCDISPIESHASNEEPLKLEVVDVEETIPKSPIFESETAYDNTFETLNDNSKKVLSKKINSNVDTEYMSENPKKQEKPLVEELLYHQENCSFRTSNASVQNSPLNENLSFVERDILIDGIKEYEEDNLDHEDIVLDDIENRSESSLSFIKEETIEQAILVYENCPKSNSILEAKNIPLNDEQSIIEEMILLSEHKNENVIDISSLEFVSPSDFENERNNFQTGSTIKEESISMCAGVNTLQRNASDCTQCQGFSLETEEHRNPVELNPESETSIASQTEKRNEFSQVSFREDVQSLLNLFEVDNNISKRIILALSGYYSINGATKTDIMTHLKNESFSGKLTKLKQDTDLFFNAAVDTGIIEKKNRRYSLKFVTDSGNESESQKNDQTLKRKVRNEDALVSGNDKAKKRKTKTEMIPTVGSPLSARKTSAKSRKALNEKEKKSVNKNATKNASNQRKKTEIKTLSSAPKTRSQSKQSQKPVQQKIVALKKQKQSEADKAERPAKVVKKRSENKTEKNVRTKKIIGKKKTTQRKTKAKSESGKPKGERQDKKLKNQVQLINKQASKSAPKNEAINRNAKRSAEDINTDNVQRVSKNEKLLTKKSPKERESSRHAMRLRGTTKKNLV